MGVRGLTSYLRENRQKLSYTLEFKTKESIPNGINGAAGDVGVIEAVVDGWSLIYMVYTYSGVPWVYGGEYAALAQHVDNVLSAWKRTGINPILVFDGPTPSIKYPTLITRLQDNYVKQANIFFRTSAAARSTPRSLAETRIAPPLGFTAILSTLLSRGDIEIEFAEGEADSHIVALAGKRGAYVIGNDSDFIVLHSEGYKGYIPVDEMVWCASVKDAAESSSNRSDPLDDDSEFQTVTRKKQKGKLKVKESRMELGNGPLPPPSHEPCELSLVLSVYEPVALAKHLTLPPSLLPLLGALVGNDYASFDFFRTTEAVITRVQRVANTLSTVLKEAQSGTAKRIRKIDRGGQGSVLDIIGTTVERLLLFRDPGYPPSNGQIDKITDVVVQSTLEYTMDSPASIFLDEAEDANQDAESQSQASLKTVDQVRNLYLRAYHRGVMHSRLIEAFARGSCFPSPFLEDPDRECCTRSIGRPIREFIWKVFATGGGIPDRLETITEDTEQRLSNDVPDDDEDELVDVVEEPSDDEFSDGDEDDDDPLAALRGKLQRLSFSGIDSDAPDTLELSRHDTASHSPTKEEELPPPPVSHRPRVITEYVRRGGRIVPEESEVIGLDDILLDDTEDTKPIQLRPVHARLRVFLKALGSDTSSIREIAAKTGINTYDSYGGTLLLIVTLRWVLQTLHARAEGMEDGHRKRDREREKWTRSEAEAFLSLLLQCEEDIEQVSPPVENRGVQLSAQVLSALEAIGWLAQALLLRLPVVLGQAEKAFSGRRFHTNLMRSQRCSNDAFQKLWDVATEGLEDVFGDERGKRGKKERKQK
ncbi:hypothetical protein K439DRAFT_1390128, partial [Ramaria rubella]